jgi:cyanophycinase
MTRDIRWKAVATVAVAAGLIAVVMTTAYLHYLRSHFAAPRDSWGPMAGGTLVICGGGRMPADVRDCFVACSGGRQARLVLIPAYQATPADVADLAAAWDAVGVESVTVLNASTRAECDSPAFVEPLANATGVWISGGDQSYLAALYADTDVERKLHALLGRGGAIGGSSAGAAILSQVMIARDGEPTVEQPGFNLLSGAVVDQHFLRRNRPRRLLEVLAKHPDYIGLGVDEHTAVVVQRKGDRWRVVGESYALICLPDADGHGFPRLEVLKAGDSTDIELLKNNPEVMAINSPADVDRMLRANSR